VPKYSVCVAYVIIGQALNPAAVTRKSYYVILPSSSPRVTGCIFFTPPSDVTHSYLASLSASNINCSLRIVTGRIKSKWAFYFPVPLLVLKRKKFVLYYVLYLLISDIYILSRIT